MATTIRQPARPHPASTRAGERRHDARWKRLLLAQFTHVRATSWVVLGLALVALNIFAYQALLVPQARDYHANWYGARWISATHPTGVVAFYRKSIVLDAPPTGAFLAVQASQYATIYANGVQIDNTKDDFATGATNRAYVYDVTPFLQAGLNTIALCATNADDGIPAARATLGLTYGGNRVVFPTNTSWLATDNLQRVGEPCSITSTRAWSLPSFDDSAWQDAANLATRPPADGVLPTPPITLETPLQTSWLSAGAGNDAFFYRSVRLSGASDTWMRVAASGAAQVYINGDQVLSQAPKLGIDQLGRTLPASVIVSAGLYDISPFLHDGQNTIGVHVTTIGTDLKTGTPRARPAAMTLDIFTTDTQGRTLHMADSAAWSVATSATPGWSVGDGTAHWLSATPIDSSIFGPRDAPFLASYKVAPSSGEIVSVSSAIGVMLLTTLLFGLACLAGVALQMRRRSGVRTLAAALDRMALALTPMVALVALLFALALEPLMPHPFPFTRLWLGILVACVALTFAVILASNTLQPIENRLIRIAQRQPLPRRLTPTALAIGVACTALMLVGLYMVTYNLAYEVYWQDEVTSVYAAIGVLHTGLPKMMSGFIYAKAELYSYVLAIPIALFGPNPIATRSISVVEYLVSLILTYFIGRYFLGRRVGLLAMTLLVFSPVALRWGREARMYQQAELFLLISVYLFYRAVQPRAATRYIYLSMLTLVVMYLSHEETFIVFPAIALYFVLTQRLTWVRNPHWWIAGCLAITAVLTELSLTKMSHPPIIGTDHTQQPLIAFSPENVNYYLRLLFASRTLKGGTLAELGVTSTLATLAMIGSLFSQNKPLRYLSLCAAAPLVTLSFLFTLTSDRYVYPILPIFCFLAAASIIWMLDVLRRLAALRLGPFARHMLVGGTGVLLIAMIIIAQTPSAANFSLATSRALGITYHHQYPDYQSAGAYIQAHWQKGDILIAVAPAIDGAFYAERPSYLLYESKALYLFEQNGHIVDTPTGSTVLLNADDLNAAMARYHRVWLWSSAAYECCGRTVKYSLQQNFTLVYEGNGTLVYLRKT